MVKAPPPRLLRSKHRFIKWLIAILLTIVILGALFVHFAFRPLGDLVIKKIVSGLHDTQNITATIELHTFAPFMIAADKISLEKDGKPLMAPLKLDITYGWPDKAGNIAVHGTARDLQDHARISFEGTANWIAHSLIMDMTLEDVNFETGVLQPDMLIPVLRGKLTNVTGAISGNAHIEYRDAPEAPMSGNASLHLKSLSALASGSTISDMNGMVVFDSLFPLTTPPEQAIQIGMLTSGLPLKNGTIIFAIDKEGMIHVSPSQWELAGGRVMTDTFTLNTASMKMEGFTLRADSLSLEELLAGVLQSGVSATGSLSGNIPITINKGVPYVKNALLITRNGGIIKYAPQSDAPLQKGNAPQTDILLNALENFHYSDLSMTMNHETQDRLAIDLHVKGANPELYDGKQIELNVHLTGDIMGLVQSGLDVYTLPERLEEQIQHGAH